MSGRLTVVQEVIEVGVGDGLAGLGPVKEGLPTLGEEGVDAAVEGSAPIMR